MAAAAAEAPAFGDALPASFIPHLAQNLVAGAWVVGEGPISRTVLNPADVRQVVADVKEASLEQVDAACDAAAKAFPKWRSTPVPERARVMFRWRELLDANFDDLSRALVIENGKTLVEARGDVRRGIEVVEYACGVPSMMCGKNLPEVAHNVDISYILEPLGVCTASGPFNFPAMIPLWQIPVAVAAGNCYVFKPAEKAPLCATRICELLAQALAECGAPAGVISCVQGGREVNERLIAHPAVQAVSFVGSTPVAESVYKASAAVGKRAMCLGGAKNHLIVMPDADLKKAIPALIGSCFGCAGQRCLAGSILAPVGDKARQDEVVEAFVAAARGLKLGSGLDASTQLGPVINTESRDRIVGWIGRAEAEGAALVLDGRGAVCESRPHGCFVGATVLDHVDPAKHAIAFAEVFGPVIAVQRAATLDEAIVASNKTPYGNSASIFTNDGAAVRTFRARIQAGMLGVNVGVPAPMAVMTSFRGWKASSFGVTGAYGEDAITFYTHKKVVTERWFGAEAPKDGWV